MSIAEAGWREHAIGTLRDGGHRSGGARTAVIDLLAQQDCCLTAQEIFDRLRADGRSVGIASVYRALEILTSAKLVQRLEMGEGIARYEPVHVGGEHHHHLVCDACGRVQAFEDDALEDALDRLGERLGFEVGGHDVVLRGSCGECR